MEEWKQRLKSAREAAGLNKTEFARAVGVSNPTITDWEKSTNDGGIKEITGDRLMKVCEVLSVSPQWLLNGDSPAPALPPGAMHVRVADQEDPDFIQIPMVKLKLQAGMTGFQTEPERRDGGTIGMRRSWVERNNYNPESLIAVHVRGESMEPSLHEGDVVIINTADKKLMDGVVYAFNYEGEAVVKRLERDIGRWWLSSDNPDKSKYGRKSCSGDECIVIGKVVRKESDRI